MHNWYVPMVKGDDVYYGFVCEVCGLMWRHQSTFCPNCVRFIYLTSPGKLTCQWCGSVWDEEIIKAMFRNEDEMLEADINIPRKEVE